MTYKKLLSVVTLLLALLSTLALSSCTQNQGTPSEVDTNTNSDTLFDRPTDISIIIGSHPSWPYSENWEFWRYFREKTGANVALTVVPNIEFELKLSLMMSSHDTLPDLIHMSNKEWVNSYANSGAFLAIDDYVDEMPNYTAFWDRVPAEERQRMLRYRLSSDGKTYFPQSYGSSHWTNLFSWMYRQDIFEKNNLTPPDTLDDLYEVSLKLKEIYPDSFPICFRQGLSRINLMGPQFKPFFTFGPYYDYANEKWSYGATEPTMLEIVEYFNKLRDKQLVPPDYLNINIRSWEELIAGDRGFIMPEYFTRIDFFNTPNRVNNPEYTWSIMMPPKSSNGTGQNRIINSNIDMQGYVLCNTGNPTRIANSVKLFDWLYTDAASELFSWGVEGETYMQENGKRKFIVNEGETAIAKYGVHSYGLYQRIEPEAINARYSDDLNSMLERAHEYLEDDVNPTQWLALTDEEAKSIIDVSMEAEVFVEEMLSKFMLGQTPMSEWDSFQNELKSMDIAKILETYEAAYNRVLEAEKS